MLKLLLLVFVVGCKSSGFTGNKDETSAAAPTPAPVIAPPPAPVPPAVIPPAPAPCTDDGVIVAKSMTQKILNGRPNQIIIFELTLKDCFGKERIIQTNQIRFDFQAVISQPVPNYLAYRLKTREQNILSSGTMDKKQGSDLFGTISPDRFYWKTVGDLKIPPTTTLLYLEIDVSNLVYHLDQTTTPIPKVEAIPMYLAFGTAAPVTTTINYENY